MNHSTFEINCHNQGKHKFILSDGSEIEGYVLNFIATQPKRYFFFDPINIFQFKRCRMAGDWEGMIKCAIPFDISTIETATKLKTGYTDIQ